jgi:hypothetical protein
LLANGVERWTDGGFGAESLPVAARGTGIVCAVAAAVTINAAAIALTVFNIPISPKLVFHYDSLARASIDRLPKLPVR